MIDFSCFSSVAIRSSHDTITVAHLPKVNYAMVRGFRSIADSNEGLHFVNKHLQKMKKKNALQFHKFSHTSSRPLEV